ncbi:3-keto-disaccharide hydrolase [Gimesia fumaroli]|uniref:3-keto-alpha-glucoside-1,2-lyase/3-keto-2-hydroxy-glucal hydratase domain-containing protein n=1 Tax=Gimesia fumaroli TaxID=2527976 RepID=A0A518IJS5_9PLAN|nr:DUF1080 domain-containing protein [Gimesia fumaroli]QDV53352.1 hypothetical protein Enr17x_54260 [Gimesia fumaroli]
MKMHRATHYFNAFTGIMAALLVSSLLGSNVYSGEKSTETEEGFISLFNGKDLTGWRIAEDGPWEVKDGMIVVTGKRSHLFTEKEFKNFEFKADVKTTPGSNSGIFFHTKFQEEGWPTQGYESQVNVTHKDLVKTGSIYNRVKLYKTPAKDNEWWTQHIIVKGRNVVIKINGETVIDYTEPEGATGYPSLGEKGSFALQAHDPKSVVYYKNIRVKPLAD